MRTLIAAALGALAVAVSAAKPQQVGDEPTCKACHTTTVEDFASHAHRQAALTCATCHGESLEHVQAAGRRPPDRVAAPHQMAALCGTCHVDQAAAYLDSVHGKLTTGLSKTRAPHCGTCHGAHRERPSAAVLRRCQSCHRTIPAACIEPRDGEPAVWCAACHRPHRFATP